MKSYFASAARALATTLGNVLRKPVTVEFPKVVRPRAERYRSSFALLHEEDGDEACIGCLQCERICPSQVISIKAGGKRESPISGKKRGYADDFVLDLNACIYCELCVQVCPTDAIVMTREPELPAYGREDLVLTMAKLYANEKSKHRAWGDATRLNGMQVAPKPPPAAKPAPASAAAPSASGGGAAAPSPGAAAPGGASPAGAAVSSGASSPATSSGTAGAAAPAPSSADQPSASGASAGASQTGGAVGAGASQAAFPSSAPHTTAGGDVDA
ncbi:MAG TPA: NADH-quinone oxidoreductase subunit I, partial [Myxococcaceae bacterium]|nr:NADH-quinone oxidoreductase subunit I [Myxococcaceae bacterium]